MIVIWYLYPILFGFKCGEKIERLVNANIKNIFIRTKFFSLSSDRHIYFHAN